MPSATAGVAAEQWPMSLRQAGTPFSVLTAKKRPRICPTYSNPSATAGGNSSSPRAPKRHSGVNGGRCCRFGFQRVRALS